MKDKCSTCLKFHFIRKLTNKKLCPFTIENLHPAPHSKMAPEPLFAGQILHNNSLTWRTIPHSENGPIRLISFKLPYSVHAVNFKKITQSIKPCNWPKKTPRWQTSMTTVFLIGSSFQSSLNPWSFHFSFIWSLLVNRAMIPIFISKLTGKRFGFGGRLEENQIPLSTCFSMLAKTRLRTKRVL